MIQVDLVLLELGKYQAALPVETGLHGPPRVVKKGEGSQQVELFFGPDFTLIPYRLIISWDVLGKHRHEKGPSATNCLNQPLLCCLPR